MDENKNQEEILSDEFQSDENPVDDIQSDEIISDDTVINNDELDTDSEFSEYESETNNTYTPILGEDAETDYLTESDPSTKKSDWTTKILIPVIVVLAAVIVALVILQLNKTNANTTANSNSNSALASSSAEVPEPSFKINGKKVDTDDLVFLKIDGNEIGFDELRTCYYQFSYGYGQYYGISEDTFKSASGDDLKNMFNSFKDSLAEYIKGGYVHASYAKKHGITFDKDDEKAVKDRIQSIKDEQGKNYKSFLKENYMTETYLNTAMKNNVLADKVEKTLSIPQKDFYKTAKKELYQVKQIFIPFGSEEKISDEVLSSNSIEDYDKLSNPKKAEAIFSNYDALSDSKKNQAKKASKKVAENIYKKLRSGADFDTLMKNNTYDSLYESYPKGVLVGKDYEYDEAYLKAALKLKENEMSEVIESSSGYHIIMRVPLNKEYINKNIEYFAQTYNDNAVNKVLYKVYENIKVEQTDTYKNFQYGDLT